MAEAPAPPPSSGRWPPRERLAAFLIVLVLGVLVAGIYAANARRFDHTAALYVGLPILMALGISLLPGSTRVISASLKWLTILLLLAVPVFREGYICVIFAAPILYIATAIIGGLIDWLIRRRATHARVESSALLAIPVLMALEGIHPMMTFDRRADVTRERIVAASVDDIRAQLARPFAIEQPMPWFIRVFPQPTEITGSGLAAGDTRTFRLAYLKWVYWNPREGFARFRIERPSENHVRYLPVSDNSFIGDYVRWQFAELKLEAIDARHTRVTLHIAYLRMLDPAWYFGPLEHLSVGQAADVFLDNGATPPAARLSRP
jgi:hypothetical protein